MEDQKRSLVPKKGPGQYGDDFMVRRVDGGYSVIAEHSELVPQSADAGDGPQHVHLMLPGMSPAHAQRVTHKRQIVAKSLSEVVALLREWCTDPATEPTGDTTA